MYEVELRELSTKSSQFVLCLGGGGIVSDSALVLTKLPIR